MKFSLDSIFNVDRRVIFVAVLLVLLVPMLWPTGMPSVPTKNVIDMFDRIDDAAIHGRPVLLSFEFDPGGKAEQEPMARAVLRHLFARHGKAVIMNKSGGQQGTALHYQIIQDCAQEFDAVEGIDYVYLPFIPGSTNVVIGLGQDLKKQYEKDRRQIDLNQIPLTRTIERLQDFDYIMIICNSMTTVGDWVTFGQGPYNLTMGFAVLGSAAPDCYGYVNSGQIKGLLGGLVGAAQYEELLVEHGINLRRRFSSADIPRDKTPGFCRELLDGRTTPVGRYLWGKLDDAQRERVESTVRWRFDELIKDDDQKIDDRKTLTDALNGLIYRGQTSTTQPDRAMTQPEKATTQAAQAAAAATQPGDPYDLLNQADIDRIKLDKDAAELLARPDIKELAEQIRRRLYVEHLFPDGLAEAQSYGMATRWMTPQSIAHVVLIVAILLANATFLWQRARKGRAQA